MHELKRRYPRYPLDKQITAYRLYDDLKVGIRGRWQQFGEGGLGAQMSEQLRSGEVLQMELSPSLKVYAAVRYSRAFYHGFEFVLLKDRQKAELARLSREMGEKATTQPPSKPS